MNDADLAIVQDGLVDDFQRVLFAVIAEPVVDEDDDAERALAENAPKAEQVLEEHLGAVVVWRRVVSLGLGLQMSGQVALVIILPVGVHGTLADELGVEKGADLHPEKVFACLRRFLAILVDTAELHELRSVCEELLDLLFIDEAAE